MKYVRVSYAVHFVVRTSYSSSSIYISLLKKHKLYHYCLWFCLTSRTTNYGRARGGQHARPSHKHCKACAKHAQAPPPRDRTRLRDFHLVEFSHQPAGETSRTTNNELHGTGWATRAPVTQTLHTVRQTCPGTTATCPYTFERKV